MAILFIVIGIVLILLNYRALKKDDTSFSSILEKQEYATKDYDLEIIKIRKDIAESILDIQQELEEMKKQINMSSVTSKEDESINNEINFLEEKLENYEDDIISEINFNSKKDISKSELVKQYIAEGLSDDDICDKLSIGKGEVLLIRSLFN